MDERNWQTKLPTGSDTLEAKPKANGNFGRFRLRGGREQEPKKNSKIVLKCQYFKAFQSIRHFQVKAQLSVERLIEAIDLKAQFSK